MREAMAHLGVDGARFAAEVGVPYSTMRAYLSAARAPSAEFLAGALRAYGVMPSWLLTGELPMTRGGRTREREREADMTGYAVIPVLPIKASAGDGAVNEPEGEYMVDGLAFSRSWMSKRGLSPGSLRVITVRGSSMEGVLSDGDQVLVDQSDTQPRSGSVFVLRQSDELLVKFCQVLPDGILRVSSANAYYPPYDVDLKATRDIAVVGRVVASMHEW